MIESSQNNVLVVEHLSKEYEKEGVPFYALKDISFSLKKGEILGIIGRNGAGKTTLFKTISQITGPTSGTIEYEGRLTSIIEIGTGFHADLSGEENVYLSATTLGYSKEDVQAFYSKIVDFSGLEEFMKMPIKHYSSGMYLRLAFSVAFNTEIDILLLDEVMSVGDEAFRRKCYDQIRQLKNRGTSIVLISHQMDPIVEFCDRCIWIDNGEMRGIGLPTDVIESYLMVANETRNTAVRSQNYEQNEKSKFGSGNVSQLKNDEIEVSEINLIDENGSIESSFHTNERILVELKCEKFTSVNSFEVSFFLINMNGIRVFIDSLSMRESYAVRDMAAGKYQIQCSIPANLLTRGVYTLGIIIGTNNEFSLEETEVCKLKVLPFENAVWENQLNYLVRPHLDWKFELQK